MSKIKICHICNMGMNGKAVFLCNLLEHTDFSKYEVTIIDCRAQPSEAILRRISVLPVVIIEPDDSSLKSSLLAFKHVLKNNCPDVVHSHMWDLSGVFLYEAKRMGVSVRVVHSHTTSKQVGRYNPVKEFLRDKILWNIFRRMIQDSANRFVACSDDAAQGLFTKRIVKNKQYSIVVNGINLEQFKPIESGKKDSVNILFAGRLHYQKNPVFVVEVFAEYHRLNPDSILTIVGKGALERQVEEKIYKHGLIDCVKVIPETSNMVDYYREADVFLLPTRYEGLGIVLIEAQACGAKCLTSDRVPSTTQCGMVHYMSLDESAEVWAQRINDILLDEEMKLDAGLLSKYGIHNTVKQLEIIYEVCE